MKKINKKKKGFTLIELVIVLAVLAIIALIAIPNFTKVRNDSMYKADQRAAEQIEKITLMAIADEKIKVANVITLTFNDDKTFKEVTTTTAMETKDKEDYQKMLSEVKKAQVNGATGYQVTVDSNLDVSVAYTGTVTIDDKVVTTLTK